jgi:hypothetical protein
MEIHDGEDRDSTNLCTNRLITFSVVAGLDPATPLRDAVPF